MNDTDLRQAYAALLRQRARERTPSNVPLEDLLELVEGRGSEAERLATVNAALADPEATRELELLRSLSRTQRGTSARRSWQGPAILLAMAASVVLVAMPVARNLTRTPAPEPERDGLQSAVLIAPPERATRTEARVFMWREVAGARSYALEILTASGTPVFTAAAADTFVRLPTDLQLAPDVDYRWWVIAELPDGTQRRSPLRRLIIRDPK